jgi:hypothetical protein
MEEARELRMYSKTPLPPLPGLSRGSDALCRMRREAGGGAWRSTPLTSNDLDRVVSLLAREPHW